MYEAMAVGCPIFAYASVSDLEEEVRWFGKRAAVADITGWERWPEVLEHPSWLKNMAQTGHLFVDGQGTSRVAAFLDHYLGTQL